MVAPQRRLALRDQTLIECGGTRNKSRSVSWNSTGQYLASGSSDRFAKIFSVEHATSGVGRELQSLTGHQATVERVRFHPTEPTVLVTAGNDATVRVWDARVAGASRCTDWTRLFFLPQATQGCRERCGVVMSESLIW